MAMLNNQRGMTIDIPLSFKGPFARWSGAQHSGEMDRSGRGCHLIHLTKSVECW